MLLGAVVRDITDPFFAGAIEALSIEAMARGYNVVLGHAQGRTDQALALTAVLETRHCDAIVLLGDMQDQPRLLADLADLARPGGRAVAGLEPAGGADGRRRQRRGRPGRPRAPRRASATRGSRSSAAATSATSASARRRSSTS